MDRLYMMASIVNVCLLFVPPPLSFKHLRLAYHRPLCVSAYSHSSARHGAPLESSQHRLQYRLLMAPDAEQRPMAKSSTKMEGLPQLSHV